MRALITGGAGFVGSHLCERLLDRGDEAGVVPLCAEHAVPYQAFGPLAGGWLTGKYRRGAPLPAGSRMTMRPEPYEHLRDERVFDGLERLQQLAAGRGTTTAALAIAWLLADPRLTAVVVGPRRPEHLEPALAALELDVDRGELAGLWG